MLLPPLDAIVVDVVKLECFKRRHLAPTLARASSAVGGYHLSLKFHVRFALLRFDTLRVCTTVLGLLLVARRLVSPVRALVLFADTAFALASLVSAFVMSVSTGAHTLSVRHQCPSLNVRAPAYPCRLKLQGTTN